MPRSLSAGLRFIPGCAANNSAWRLNSSGYFFMSIIFPSYPDPIGQYLSPQNRGKISRDEQTIPALRKLPYQARSINLSWQRQPHIAVTNRQNYHCSAPAPLPCSEGLGPNL